MGLQAGTRLGPYEIIALIGAGGMGEVYRARDRKLNRDVAVKVLPQHLSADRLALERLEREAKTLAATSHPNILSIFDFGSSDGVTYAVMELLDGDTVRSLLMNGALPVRKAVDYATQIAEGLAAAHDRGITHRDLKPENLFVTRDGRVKILDFGLARQQVVLSPDDATVDMGGTEPGTVLGTVGYMSPEQVRGKSADSRSDIFSFGAVLYEMLSGRRAFHGDSAAETLHAILRDEPPQLTQTAKHLPPALDRIVTHCLEKTPDERFQSTRDLAFNLESLTIPSDPARSGAVAASNLDRKRPTMRAITFAACAAAGAVAAWTFKPAPATTPSRYQRLTFERGTTGQARFAPDGQTVVYGAKWRGEPSQVFTTRTDSRESRSLGIGHSTLVAVSPVSELAVGMDTDSVYADPITLGRVPLAGGATRAAVENATFADWTADGSSLVVVRVVGGKEQIEFPAGSVVYRTNAVLTHLRVSPRGDLVAFAEHPATYGTTRGSVAVLDRTGVKRVLSSGWADLWGIAWRPDGQEVWFTAASGPREPKALQAVTLDGKVRLVTRALGQINLEDISKDDRVLVSSSDYRAELIGRESGAASERPLTWLGLSMAADLSANGTLVLFSELPVGGGNGEDIYLRRMDGSPAVRLGDGAALALSPDGKWALGVSSDSARLMAVPTGAGEVTDLTRPGLTYGFATPAGEIAWGRWLPDSHGVIFNAVPKGGTLRLFEQQLSDGDPKPVGPPGLAGEIVSPDGRSVVAAPFGEVPMLYSLESGGAAPLKGIEKSERAIQWSADGRSVFVTRAVGLTAEITAVDIATGRRRLLRDLTPADPAGAATPVSIAMGSDGQSYTYTFFRNISDLYVVDGLK